MQEIPPEQVRLATLSRLKGLLARNQEVVTARQAERVRRRKARKAHKSSRARVKQARRRNRN